MREAVKVRPLADANNVVAEMRRRELRDAVAAMSDDERIAYVLNVNDNEIVAALLDQPAVVTSIPEEIFAKVEAAYVERMFGKELQEIKAFEAIIAEAEAAASVARDEMQRTIGLECKQFDEIVVPIETKARAPWLLKEATSGKVLVVRPGESTYPVATEDELRDGVFYANAEEYERANGRVPAKAA
jgi:hypothetical protein